MNGVNLMEAHNQWATRPQDERFQTMEELAASVNSRRMRSRSVDVSTGKTKVVSELVDDKATLKINGTITPCEPTHWSFGQLSTMVGAPASYLRTLPQELIVRNLNHGLSQNERDVKFMTISGDDSNTLQAVTSPTYGRIWDADVVSATQRIVERSGGRFHNPKAYAHKGTPDGFNTLDTSIQVPSGLYASDRDCFMFLVDGGSYLEAGPRAKLNRGFIVWNSEVGARTFGLMTFLFNGVCGNHIIWGATDVNKLVIRHTANGPTRFDNEAAPQLLNYVEQSAKPIETAIQKAQALVIVPNVQPDKLQSELMAWADKHGKFTKAEITGAITLAKHEEGDCRTLWQFVQGMTAYARGFDWVDARFDLEKRAGKLLDLVAE